MWLKAVNHFLKKLNFKYLAGSWIYVWWQWTNMFFSKKKCLFRKQTKKIAQKMKFFIKYFFSKCYQIRSFIFCAVHNGQFILGYKDHNHWASLQSLVALITLQSTIVDIIVWDLTLAGNRWKIESFPTLRYLTRKPEFAPYIPSITVDALQGILQAVPCMWLSDA